MRGIFKNLFLGGFLLFIYIFKLFLRRLFFFFIEVRDINVNLVFYGIFGEEKRFRVLKVFLKV